LKGIFKLAGDARTGELERPECSYGGPTGTGCL